MKIVVIGGTGLIGGRVVAILRRQGHDVTAASPRSGVNTITGDGLAAALAGAQVVVDVSNSPSFEKQAVMEFFTTSGRNLAAAEKAAGVRHHVALSIVGCDRVPDSDYLVAKVAQEKLIRSSGIPYSIVRATQFFEFMDGIAQSATEGDTVRLPPAQLQPMAADDVATQVAATAVASPLNGVVDIAGPDRIGLDQLVRRYLESRKDPRQVVTDPRARYFGAELDDASLTPGGKARISSMSFETWLGHQSP